jgi:hypothetical protein
MELHTHRVVHGADATRGPYGPDRAWPPKRNIDDGEAEVPGSLARETITDEGVHTDPVTGEKLAPLQHEGLPRNPSANPNPEGQNPQEFVRCNFVLCFLKLVM